MMKYAMIVGFLLVPIIASAAGSKGRIAGTVVSRTALEPLPGANVVVEGTSLGAATDADGKFVIKNLDAGSYNLRVQYIGYKKALKANVFVAPGRTTQLHFELEPDVIEGQTVEVSAGYFEKAKDAVVSTRSMDFEEIRRSPGAALDIQRVMQALPAVVSGTDQNNEIIIRGGIPGENLFLMDNIEIPNPNHFGEQGTGGGPINMLNTYMIREVDFYAGAFSAKYGDRASSVMDISLREGSRERMRIDGHMGMAGAGILVEGPIHSMNGSYIFSARRSFLDLIISSMGLTAVPKYSNFQGKLAFKLGSRSDLWINGIYGVDAINIEDEGTGGYSRGAENVDYNGDQWAGGMTLRTFWADRLYSYTTLSTVRNNWEVDVYESRPRETYFQNMSKEYEHTLKTDFVWQPFRRFELNWGASYKIVQFDHNMWSRQDTLFIYDRTGVDPDTVLGVFRTYPEWTDRRQDDSYKTAAYLQASVDILPRLRLTGGVRHDYFDYNEFQSLSPRLGISFTLDHRTTLNLAYGLHYQSPSYFQLTANDRNRGLKNKYTRQYVVGLDRLLRDDVRLTIEAYHKTYHDVPVARGLTTPDPYDSFDAEMLNAGTGIARGVEFFLQKKLTQSFHSIISYSRSISRATDPRFGTEYDWDYDFRNVFTFIGGYKAQLHKREWYRRMKEKLWYKATGWLLPLADEVEISVKFRYLGGRPYTPPVYHPELHGWVVEEQARLNPVRYPVYHRLDLRIDRRYIFDKWNMVVFFDMMNLYNRHNIWEYQYNDDGSREEVLQFEVLPVGGVAMEF